MLKIYRTSSPDIHSFEEDEPVVRFGPEHTWLAKAVAVPRYGDGGVMRGPVEDGHITDETSGDTLMIWKGDDEGVAYHEYCYELIGSPTKAADVVTGVGLFGWAIVDGYNGQLFEHHEFRAHGFGWMTEDPTMSQRSRDHLTSLAAQAKSPLVRNHTTVREVVASPFGWAGVIMREETNEPVHVVRYRTNLHRDLDTADYPVLVWAMKDTTAVMPTGADMQALFDYETALIAAAERDDAAVVLMTTIGRNQTQYLIQARDEAATTKVLSALPSPQRTTPIHFDNEKDPGWTNFFEKMNPGRHGR